ncbi:MAG: hypothetical protein [Microviridae sp.]|nr:MAG: hypothetical protein [Microviridae sp.]
MEENINCQGTTDRKCSTLRIVLGKCEALRYRLWCQMLYNVKLSQTILESLSKWQPECMLEKVLKKSVELPLIYKMLKRLLDKVEEKLFSRLILQPYESLYFKDNDKIK